MEVFHARHGVPRRRAPAHAQPVEAPPAAPEGAVSGGGGVLFIGAPQRPVPGPDHVALTGVGAGNGNGTAPRDIPSREPDCAAWTRRLIERPSVSPGINPGVGGATVSAPRVPEPRIAGARVTARAIRVASVGLSRRRRLARELQRSRLGSGPPGGRASGGRPGDDHRRPFAVQSAVPALPDRPYLGPHRLVPPRLGPDARACPAACACNGGNPRPDWACAAGSRRRSRPSGSGRIACAGRRLHLTRRGQSDRSRRRRISPIHQRPNHRLRLQWRAPRRYPVQANEPPLAPAKEADLPGVNPERRIRRDESLNG